ncbi:hypothetical protein QMO17_32790, partial [Klebsiella pneumoniae]|nr:hypothetical protein [Klebsiella pneumoniae]
MEKTSAANAVTRRKDRETNKVDFKMHPVDFGGHFGWLYEPVSRPDKTRQLGIVLCGPLGHEALWLHQT